MASLKAQLEEALGEFLAANITTEANYYTGFDSEDRVAPAVICRVASMEEEPAGTRNFRCACEIMAKDTVGAEANQSALSGEIEAALCGGIKAGLQENLTGIEVCLAPASEIKFVHEGVQDSWVSTYTFDVIARGVLTA